MKDFGGLEIVVIVFLVGMFSLALAGIIHSDKQNNSRWDLCQLKYEQSGIPHEGRENFMRGCWSE